ncbi:ribosome-inactivating family protein [Spiroplasma endosymbiont of Polydrusus pterygomalis]|uniref:ribosome-inactivating family protein n=1 Tax=Spiroplasma endosymbiont of Polydrusus pterygomalis TaxID=3139327 RepID=UPI003CCB100F
MKKLLGLLGTIVITCNAIPSVIATAPNIKHNIKKRQNNENISTTPKMQDDKNSELSTTSDSEFDIIEKEIILNENYSDNIQKILKELIKNNQLDPLRMINNEGIVRTDYFETQDKRNERESNIKIIEKLEKILELRKFDANKIRILVLTLKNKDNNEIKLIINLDNFYLQGFINNQKQYFYFKEEKSLEQWNKEKKKIENQLNEWKILEGKFNSLSLNDETKNKIKEIDKFKDESKPKLNQENSEENKKIIRLIQNNSFTKIEESCQDDEIKQKILEFKPFWNIYQKIQKIRQNALNLLKKGKSEIKKEYEENIKKYQWDNVFNKIASNIESNINTIEHKKIKENKINEEIIKKYSTNESNKNKLNYNGSYQDKGLNTVNQNIDITKKNLNNAITNLSFLDNESNQNQTTKNDLTKVIFITSEAMRFGSYIKFFNYEKDGNQVEFKNIQEDIQNIINSVNNDEIQWKDYYKQLIGGWKASSKCLEEERKKIFQDLKIGIIVSKFISISKNLKKLNEILERQIYQKQNWEKIIIEPDFNEMFESFLKENYQNETKEFKKEAEIIFLDYFKKIFKINEKTIEEQKERKQKHIIGFQFVELNKEFIIMKQIILQNNLDIFNLILFKKPEIINVKN